jgi:IS605 OrfB family transposase
VCKNVPRPLLPKTAKTVGIDLGVVTLATLSDGVRFENPRYKVLPTKVVGPKATPNKTKSKKTKSKKTKSKKTKSKKTKSKKTKLTQPLAEQIKTKQRQLAHKERGSKNYALAKAQLAELHAKQQRQMKSYQHQVSHDLILSYDVLILEDLDVKHMTKSAKGTVEHPERVAQKTGLNRSMHDAALSQFTQMITYKAANAGRRVILVNPRNTSITCSQCGYISKRNRPTQASFECLRCTYSANADFNAAGNIYRAGRALLAAT